MSVEPCRCHDRGMVMNRVRITISGRISNRVCGREWGDILTPTLTLTLTLTGGGRWACEP